MIEQFPWFSSWLAMWSFAFGATLKLADLTNEHGWKPFFNGLPIRIRFQTAIISYIFGFAWGCFAISIFAFSVGTNSLAAPTILALILSYIARGKIDYSNHILGATVFLVGVILFSTPRALQTHFPNLLIILVMFYALGIAHDLLVTRSVHSNLSKVRLPSKVNFNKEIFHTGLSYILIPVIISWWLHDPSPAIVMGLAGGSYEVVRAIHHKVTKAKGG